MKTDAQIRAELERLMKLPWGGSFDEASEHIEHALKWALGDDQTSPVDRLEEPFLPAT
jgi:hypothetical protein